MATPIQPHQFNVVSPGGMWSHYSGQQGTGQAVDPLGHDAGVRLRTWNQGTSVTGQDKGWAWQADRYRGEQPPAMRSGDVRTHFRATVAAESMARRMVEGRDLKTGRQPYAGPW